MSLGGRNPRKDWFEGTTIGGGAFWGRSPSSPLNLIPPPPQKKLGHPSDLPPEPAPDYEGDESFLRRVHHILLEVRGSPKPMGGPRNLGGPP